MATRHATSAPDSVAPGTLFIVATPIGNLRDVTLRALDVLRSVSLIAAEDTRRTATLLLHYGIDTPTRSFHEHNESRRTPVLLDELRSGRSIALVTDAGTPLVSDPGARLVSRALADGIRVEPIPGPSALLAALVMSGLPSHEFTFAGFPPSRSNARKRWLEELARDRRTLVIFESPHRIRRTLGDMTDVFGDVEVAVCRELTKIHEELVKGPISSVAERLPAPRGEFTVVIGPRSAVVDRSTGPGDEPSDATLSAELSHMTEHGRTRRQSVRDLATRYGLKARDVYQRIERGKEQ